MKSTRKDGLGHWPKGKRRNADAGDWQVIRLGLQALLNDHGEPGVISLQVIGDAVGVDKKTVHKWLHGVNRPNEEAQGLLRAWLRQTRAKIDAKKKRQ
jgi:hypothetical protein